MGTGKLGLQKGVHTSSTIFHSSDCHHRVVMKITLQCCNNIVSTQGCLLYFSNLFAYQALMKLHLSRTDPPRHRGHISQDQALGETLAFVVSVHKRLKL